MKHMQWDSYRPSLWAALLATALGVLSVLRASAAESLPAFSGAGTQDTDRIVVRYSDDPRRDPEAMAVRAARLRDEFARHGLSARKLRGTGQGGEVWTVGRHLPIKQMEALASSIALDPLIQYAEPDRKVRAAMYPNDPLAGAQWPIANMAGSINVQSAWEFSSGAGVVVAVIDTGYRPHADLTGNLVPGYDFVIDQDGRDADASDPGDWRSGYACGPDRNSTWHGTKVAGIIGALTNNSWGMAGIAFGAKVQPVRVLGTCDGYDSDIADAILWASGEPIPGVPANPTPARVLNLSLGGIHSCPSFMASAVAIARSRGALVVASAGNSGADLATLPTSPATCPGVLAVAATGVNGLRVVTPTWASNFGSVVALSAPGTSITTLSNAGTSVPAADSYDYGFNGTSAAAPHVSAVAALMLSVNPSLSPQLLTNYLKYSARPFPGICVGCGAGLLDASGAVQAAISPSSLPPRVDINPEVINKSRNGNGTITVSVSATPVNATPPYTYLWSSQRQGTTLPTFTIANPTAATTTLTATFTDVCTEALRIDDSLYVRVNDGAGRVLNQVAGVSLVANARGDICN